MATRKKTITVGIAVAAAVLASLTAVWIAVPLWVITVLLFGCGLQPKLTKEFVGRLPYGSSYILKALANLDSMAEEIQAESKMKRLEHDHFRMKRSLR
jgi:hypothetical protein